MTEETKTWNTSTTISAGLHPKGTDRRQHSPGPNPGLFVIFLIVGGLTLHILAILVALYYLKKWSRKRKSVETAASEAVEIFSVEAEMQSQREEYAQLIKTRRAASEPGVRGKKTTNSSSSIDDHEDDNKDGVNSLRWTSKANSGGRTSFSELICKENPEYATPMSHHSRHTYNSSSSIEEV